MPQPSQCVCEYVLIRLAPDPVRGEHVNIGVALYAAEAGGFTGVRINPNFGVRARQLSPLFDPADLAGLEADLLERLRTAAPPWRSREYFLELAQETFSHCLQLTPPAAVLTLDPAAELDRLYRQYAAPLTAPETALQAGRRRRILRHLHRVFTEERVLAHLQRNLRAGEWLDAPDAFRFDFHYQAAGLRHLIQAMPLGGEEAPVKALCFTVGRLRAALGKLDVAAFSDDDPPAEEPDAPAPLLADPRRFHRSLLDDAGVRLLTLAQAPAEAARIRAALNLP